MTQRQRRWMFRVLGPVMLLIVSAVVVTVAGVVIRAVRTALLAEEPESRLYERKKAGN